MTMTGQFVGSLPWASPEQAEGVPEKIDVRTDVYSLGIILYYLLTQRFPYPVIGNIRDVVDNILTADPEKPSQFSQDIDDEVETIVLRCLSKERDRRYQSAGELARDIQHYLSGEPIEAKRDSQWYMLKKMLHRYRIGVGVSTLFIVMITTFGITMSILYQREQKVAQQAQQTLSFLQDTLFQASSQRLGSDATLSEVLDYASQQLSEQFLDQPAALASLHYTIGCAYETIWRKEEAVEHLRIAADTSRQLYGMHHPDTQKFMVMFGMLLAEMNQPESVRIQEEVLTTRLKQYGEHHFFIADSKNELAYALWTSAKPPRLDEAELLYQESHQLYQEIVDGQYPDYARSLHGYAGMKHVHGDFHRAAELLEQSLAMSRTLLGEDHQFVLECMRDYAETLKELGQYDQAEQLLQQVLVKTPRLFGRSWTPNILRRIASVQRRRGHLSESEKSYKESVAMQCENLADKHPEKKNTLLSYAQTMRTLESPADASTLGDVFLLINELTGQPINTARTLVSIAGVTREQYGHGVAAPIVIEAINLLELDPEKSGWYLGYAKGTLGRYYIELKLYTEAKTLLLEGLAILKTHIGEDHPITKEVVDALAAR